jgi:hypothetical protein
MMNTCKFRVGTGVARRRVNLGAGSVSAQSYQLLNPFLKQRHHLGGRARHLESRRLHRRFPDDKDALQGTNVMALFAYGSATACSNNVLRNPRPAFRGGRLAAHPAGPARFQPTNGYCALLVQFLMPADQGERQLVFARSRPIVRQTGPDIPPRVVDSGQCRHVPRDLHLCGGAMPNGRLGLYDDLHACTTTVDQAGALLNPGLKSNRGCAHQCPYWLASHAVMVW